MTNNQRPTTTLMRIAVDAMGGDHAPGSIIDGALAAARHLNIGLVLTGRSDLIDAELARHPDAGELDIRVIDAPDVVGMGESPTSALRRKSRTSIRQAAELMSAIFGAEIGRAHV